MTEERLRDEALRLVAVAEEADIPVRVLGGVAVSLLVPDWPGRGDRPGRDLDVATNQASRRRLTELLEKNGYEADRRYNSANGHKQLYFLDPARGRPLDVLLDRMEMCHTFDFRESLEAAGPTVSPADLLLSKLQIVRLTQKDIVDGLVLLSEVELVNTGDHGIRVPRIVRYCSSDWGWWRTAMGSLETMRTCATGGLRPGELDLGRPARFDPIVQIDLLRRSIDEAPKSLGWQIRSRIGERIPWYEEPEEETHA